MITIKISKKTPILLLLLMALAFMGTGCLKNQVTPHEGSIRLYLDSEFTQYMPYTDVPDFTFTFEGIVNTISYSPDTNATVFASNDDVVFSGMVANLIAAHGVATEVVGTKTSPTTQINTKNEEQKITPHQYPVDDETVYDEVAYLAFENGLKMTINYRRFISNGVAYYCWRYSSNITFYLYYPMMVVEENGAKELRLLALPNRVTFQVGSQLKASSLMSKDDYLSEAKYSFSYYEDETIEDPAQYVKDYYMTHHQGEEMGELFTFVYLGYRYQVIFHEQGFTIHYLEVIA